MTKAEVAAATEVLVRIQAGSALPSTGYGLYRTALPAALDGYKRAMGKLDLLTASHELDCQCSACVLVREWHGE